MGGHSHGSELTSSDLHRVNEFHHEFLGSFLGRYGLLDRVCEEICLFCSMHNHLFSFVGVNLFSDSKEKAKDSIIYSYKRHINGFAAVLEEEDASEIASMTIHIFLYFFPMFPTY